MFEFQIAEMIRYVIDAHVKPVPAVLEIPSKDHPYDPNKDSILRRAKVYLLVYLNCFYLLFTDHFITLKLYQFCRKQ